MNLHDTDYFKNILIITKNPKKGNLLDCYLKIDVGWELVSIKSNDDYNRIPGNQLWKLYIVNKLI